MVLLDTDRVGSWPGGARAGRVRLARARRTKRLGVHYSDAATKVLIVGGGFGGLAAARELTLALGGSQKVGVALLDRVNFLLRETRGLPKLPELRAER